MNALLDYAVMKGSMQLAVTTLVLLVGVPTAEAQIYKYQKGDGTVVYTDSLAELPNERRAYYNRRQAELDAKAREEESVLGAEELERRRLEKERAALAAEALEEAERRERMAALDAQLARYKSQRQAAAADEKRWRDRMKRAREQLQNLLTQFRKKQAEHTNLAMKPDFTRLPGEADKQEILARELKTLETAIDAQIEEVEVKIPEEARRARVPPGWLR